MLELAKLWVLGFSAYKGMVTRAMGDGAGSTPGKRLETVWQIGSKFQEAASPVRVCSLGRNNRLMETSELHA